MTAFYSMYIHQMCNCEANVFHFFFLHNGDQLTLLLSGKASCHFKKQPQVAQLQLNGIPWEESRPRCGLPTEMPSSEPWVTIRATLISILSALALSSGIHMTRSREDAACGLTRWLKDRKWYTSTWSQFAQEKLVTSGLPHG